MTRSGSTDIRAITGVVAGRAQCCGTYDEARWLALGCVTHLRAGQAVLVVQHGRRTDNAERVDGYWVVTAAAWATTPASAVYRAWPCILTHPLGNEHTESWAEPLLALKVPTDTEHRRQVIAIGVTKPLHAGGLPKRGTGR